MADPYRDPMTAIRGRSILLPGRNARPFGQGPKAARGGGSVPAEQGTGLSMPASMRRRTGPVAPQMMRAIERGFDPAAILNPGKTIP